MADSASGVSKTRVLAEAGGQPVGDAEDPAQRADVLAEHDHPVVGGQAVGQRPVERARHRHRTGPPAARLRRGRLGAATLAGVHAACR